MELIWSNDGVSTAKRRGMKGRDGKENFRLRGGLESKLAENEINKLNSDTSDKSVSLYLGSKLPVVFQKITTNCQKNSQKYNFLS